MKLIKGTVIRARDSATVTDRKGNKVAVIYRVEVSEGKLRSLASKAARNKSGESHDGPLRVVILEARQVTA